MQLPNKIDISKNTILRIKEDKNPKIKIRYITKTNNRVIVIFN